MLMAMVQGTCGVSHWKFDSIPPLACMLIILSWQMMSTTGRGSDCSESTFSALMLLLYSDVIVMPMSSQSTSNYQLRQHPQRRCQRKLGREEAAFVCSVKLPDLASDW